MEIHRDLSELPFWAWELEYIALRPNIYNGPLGAVVIVLESHMIFCDTLGSIPFKCNYF